MKRVLVIFSTLSLVIANAGCATQSKTLGGDPAIRIVDSAAMAAPVPSDYDSDVRPYRIGPFDKLVISVFGMKELTDLEIQTDASGRIAFPLAGIVEAAGKSPGELAGLIEERLRTSFVRDPKVTVNLKETMSQVVTVDGEVKEPGLYPVIGRMTLMRAVATAKGTSEFAKLDDVVIFRTVGGQKLAALYNLKAIRRGAYEDPEVYANDVVVVGDSSARRLFKDLLQVVPLISTPLVVALTRN